MAAFLPEIDAYADYFSGYGVQVSVHPKGHYNADDYDAVLLFHGFHPFWGKYPKIIIGEYHSLSVGKFGRLKDALKRIFNVRSDFYIFLNSKVRKGLRFKHSSSVIYREMGYYADLIKSPRTLDFDIVYSGSMRKGVEATLMRLADMGLSLAVVGNSKEITHDNISCYGRVSVAKSYEIVGRAKYGLNITPDIFPLNVQDSTKVIEYCALGLGVITNKYEWVSSFELSRNAQFIDIEDVLAGRELFELPFTVPDVSDLEWSRVLNRTKLAQRLLSCGS